MINPQIVLCLGKEVQKLLKGYSTIFDDLTFDNYELTTNTAAFESRKFVLIPHPSMANSNWGKSQIREKMKTSLAN